MATMDALDSQYTALAASMHGHTRISALGSLGSSVASIGSNV